MRLVFCTENIVERSIIHSSHIVFDNIISLIVYYDQRRDALIRFFFSYFLRFVPFR